MSDDYAADPDLDFIDEDLGPGPERCDVCFKSARDVERDFKETGKLHEDTCPGHAEVAPRWDEEEADELAHDDHAAWEAAVTGW